MKLMNGALNALNSYTYIYEFNELNELVMLIMSRGGVMRHTYHAVMRRGHVQDMDRGNIRMGR